MNGKRIKRRIYLIFALCMVLLFTGCGKGAAGGNTQPFFRETEAGTEDRITQEVAGSENAESETGESEAENPTTENFAEPSADEATAENPPETAAEELAAAPAETAADEPVSTEESGEQTELPVEGSYYYDLENVVLYLYLYNELPPNYITKNEAEALGWSGGSVERYQDGAAIGGDRFGNREGLLPTASGRKYTECDLDTLGASSRGAKRLVFSNDGLYFYTDDHYESFNEVIVQEDYTVEVLR